MESFLVAINAVIPFLFYLCFGFGAKVLGVADEAFFNRMNGLVFKLFYPFMCFYNIYQADRDSVPSVRVIVFIVGGILLLQALLIFLVPRLVKENERRGVIIQATYRSNFVLLGLALTESVYGGEAVASAAMLIAVVLLLFNTSSVVILEMYSGKPKTGAGALVRSLAKNPLLQGAALGLLFFVLGIKLPDCLDAPVASFANMTTPLALFILGGTLHFSAIRGNLRYLVPVTAAKLLVVPAVALAAGWLCGLRGEELFFVLMVYGTPVATASFPMAKNMGGDGQLAGQLVVISTVASVLTLFFWVFFMKSAAMI